MTILVPISLIGWLFVAVAMFVMMPPRRAVLASYMLAWMFLPQASIDLPGLPDLNKMNVTSWGALVGVVLFDAQRLARFRFRWVDLPVVMWCVASFMSSVVNEAPPEATSPLYDGLSGFLKDGLGWAVPYFLGRMYFSELVHLRELAIAVVIGGLIYIPLCLFEIRMSPCLHLWAYGFHPAGFEMALRFGGYRPMVFMQHGLMVSMWMGGASLVAVWMWKNGALQRLWNIPAGSLSAALVIVTILCKSVGAIALMALGLSVLFANRQARSSVLIIALIVAPLAYMAARAQGWWSGSQLVQMASLINEERADSLQGRLESEDQLTAKAAQKPWFGWGGWGRWRIYDPYTGRDITVSDGMWVITYGERGLLGLVSMTVFVLLPSVLFLRRVPVRQWAGPWFAAPAALAMLLLMYFIDCLFNAMLNPICFLAAGGLSGFYLLFPQLQAMARREQLTRRNDRPLTALPDVAMPH